MRLFVALGIAGLLLAACGDSGESAPSVDPATALVGLWSPIGGGDLTFQEGGTWTWMSASTTDEGGYAFEDGVVTLTTDVGSTFCPGETGIYEVVFESQDEMAWTVVSDECAGRIRNIGARWVSDDQLLRNGETIPRFMP